MRKVWIPIAACCAAALLGGCGGSQSPAGEQAGNARQVDACADAWNDAGEDITRSLAAVAQMAGHSGRLLVASYQGPEQQVGRLGGGDAIVVSDAACIVVSDAGLVFVQEGYTGWGKASAVLTEDFSRFVLPGAVDEAANASTLGDGRIELDVSAPDTTLSAEDVNGDPPGSPTTDDVLQRLYCEQHPDDKSCDTGGETTTAGAEPTTEPVSGAADTSGQAVREVCGTLDAGGTRVQVRTYGAGVLSCAVAQRVVQELIDHKPVSSEWACAPAPQLKCSHEDVTVLGAVV